MGKGAKERRELIRKEYDGFRSPPFGSETWKLLKTRPALVLGKRPDGTFSQIDQLAVFVDEDGGEHTITVPVAKQMGLIRGGEVPRRRVTIQTFIEYVRNKFSKNVND